MEEDLAALWHQKGVVVTHAALMTF